MNFMKALNLYKSLRPEQKDFLRGKRIRDSRDRAAWIGFISGMVAFDRELDKIRSVLAWTGGLLFLPALAGAIGFSAYWPLLLVPLSFALFFIRSRLGGLDLPVSPGAFLIPLLTLLEEETEPETAIALNLDLRGFKRPDKIMSQSGPNTDRLTFYRDPWVESTFILGDGSRLHWEIVDIVRSRYRLKRGSSGKSKWKTKVKVRRIIDVRLRVKSKVYELDASKAEPPTPDLKVKLKPGERRGDIRIRKRFAPLTPDTPPEITDVVDTVAAAYRRLSASDKPQSPRNPVGAG